MSGLVSIGDGETYDIPAEVAEQRYGVEVENYGLNDEPGGEGRFRGGRGLERTYRILSDEAILTVAFGRHDVPPWGYAGGDVGSPNYVEIVPVDGSPSRRFGKAAAVPLVKGDRVRIVTGSGGGWGPVD